ncbi:uncharacterized protein BJ171DRAFT_422071, partial [Polychytrium aggregatum]|uniref:uncharacterized protein n=1 Tax=Polychytrium aggregatum TaxID=110093 RepID=UPI0022FE79E2
QVVVRVRPFNSREISKACKCIIKMQGPSTVITKPLNPSASPSLEPYKSQQQTEESLIKHFTFDASYWSFDTDHANHANQETVYQDVGKELLEHSLEGYNVCIFAYGQTGSGKSYTMMGYQDSHGIIPRFCKDLFEQIEARQDEHKSFSVQVSYMEIYNEKVRDLLNPSNKGNLRIREHPSLGPYVEDLSKMLVNSFEEVSELMDEGNKARTVAATNMNEVSSRSHAVFTLNLTQRLTEPMSGLQSETVSRICLVDLAGSERADATGATGQRLKEGANINKSLTTLGKVISALAENSSDVSLGRKASILRKSDHHIPYRDSVLTWLLKDCLGGNSKTVMIAAISPADVSYDETLSTLRYAERAKRIVNKAVINEDSNGKLMKELQREVEVLRARLAAYESDLTRPKLSIQIDNSRSQTGTETPTKVKFKDVPVSAPAFTIEEVDEPQEPRSESRAETENTDMSTLKDQLEATEKLITEITESYEEKLKKTQLIQSQREKALMEMGIALEPSKTIGLYTPQTVAHLLNLNEDPLMNECLIYHIPKGETVVGSQEGADILLSSDMILPHHCTFVNNDEEKKVFVIPTEGSMVMVNGHLVSEKCRLKSGFRLILGSNHVFRFNNPEELRMERASSGASQKRTSHLSFATSPESGEGSSATAGSDVIDWNYAQRERERINGPMDGFPAVGKGSLVVGDASAPHTRESSVSQPEQSSEAESHPEVDKLIHDMETQMYAVREREASRLIEESMRTQKVQVIEEELKIEKERMERLLEMQRLNYEAKLRRISVKAKGSSQAGSTSSLFSPHHQQLARKFLARWRSRKFIKLAEEILTNTVKLKEANVIAQELRKQVMFQFVIVDNHFNEPTRSFWEQPSEAAVLGDAKALQPDKPYLGVRVMDMRSDSIQIWPFSTLAERLPQMQGLYNFGDTSSLPTFTPLPTFEDPFRGTVHPYFDFLGVGWVSVNNLAFGFTKETVCPIIQLETGETLGRLRVIISPITADNNAPSRKPGYRRKKARPARSGNESSDEHGSDDDAGSEYDSDDFQDSPPRSPISLDEGKEILFEVSVLELQGISETEYTQLHCQFRLSEFDQTSEALPSSQTTFQPTDRVYATDPAVDFGDTCQFDLTQSVKIKVTDRVKDIIEHGMVAFEIFGRRCHTVQELVDNELGPSLSDSDSDDDGSVHRPKSVISRTNSVRTVRTTRSIRSMINLNPNDDESELERHSILAQLQILELSHTDGRFKYVPVQDAAGSINGVTGVFLMRQGLQRRISLRITHTSGKEFPWSTITAMSVGNIRLAPTNKLQEAASGDNNMISLNVTEKEKKLAIVARDGRTVLEVECPWDSSLHESELLNRVSRGKRLLIDVCWTMETSLLQSGERSSIGPVHFSTTVALQIYDRDFKVKALTNARLMGLLTGTGFNVKHMNHINLIYVIALQKEQERKRRDWAKMDTSGIYVRGEECLNGWKPDGIELLLGYQKAIDRVRWRQEVEMTRQRLGMDVPASSTSGTKEPAGSRSGGEADKRDQILLLRKCLELWRRRSTRMTTSDLVSAQICTIGSCKDERECASCKRPGGMCRFDGLVSKRGWLACPEDRGESWVKRWFVIRRPYMHVFANNNEAEQISTICLENVTITDSPDLWSILQRPNVFAVSTKFHNILLQAQTIEEMAEWINTIDPLHSAAILSRIGHARD